MCIPLELPGISVHFVYLDAALKYAADVKDLIDHATPGKVAAFIAEAIQGVGGTVPLPDGYLKEVRVCTCDDTLANTLPVEDTRSFCLHSA